MVRVCGPLFGAAAEGSRPHAGAAQTHKEQHGIARSGAELFRTLQLTSHGFPLVSGLQSLTPSSLRACEHRHHDHAEAGDAHLVGGVGGPAHEHGRAGTHEARAGSGAAAAAAEKK